MFKRTTLQLMALAAPTLVATYGAQALPPVPFTVFSAAGPWLTCPSSFFANGVQFATRVHNLAPGGPVVCGGASQVGPPGLGSGQALLLNNINIAPNIPAVPPVTFAAFDYLNLGGLVNLRINGTLVVAPDFAAIPAVATPVGLIMVNVGLPMPPGGARTVTLVGGPITNLQIGGQNLVIDNVFIP